MTGTENQGLTVPNAVPITQLLAETDKETAARDTSQHEPELVRAYIDELGVSEFEAGKLVTQDEMNARKRHAKRNADAVNRRASLLMQLPAHIVEDRAAWDRAFKRYDDHYLNATTKELAEKQRAMERAEKSEQGGNSWSAVDVDEVLSRLDDPDSAVQPVYLERPDGQALIYPGKVHTVFGESESAKSWLCLLACLDAIRRGETACFLDFEDDPDSVIGRMLTLGATKNELRRSFRYVSPVSIPEEGTPGHDELQNHLRAGYAVVVIAAFTEATMVMGLSGRDESDVAKVHHLLTRPFSREGAAVLAVDHIGHDSNAKNRPVGSQHKKAGVHVGLKMDIQQKPAPGRLGILHIWVNKDRPGQLRRASLKHRNDLDLVAGFELGHPEMLQDFADGTTPYGRIVMPSLTAPRTDSEAAADVDPLHLRMEQVSEAVNANPGITTRALESVVGGNAGLTRKAIDRLMESPRFIRCETEGRSKRFFNERRYIVPRGDSAEDEGCKGNEV